GPGHLTVLLEQGQQVVGRGVPREVADVDILRHRRTFPRLAAGGDTFTGGEGTTHLPPRRLARRRGPLAGSRHTQNRPLTFGPPPRAGCPAEPLRSRGPLRDARRAASPLPPRRVWHSTRGGLPAATASPGHRPAGLLPFRHRTY